VLKKSQIDHPFNERPVVVTGGDRDFAGEIVNGVTSLADDQQLGGRGNAINELMGSLETRPSCR
jgi:hypothetical protein